MFNKKTIKPIKGVKGFNKNLTSHGFQYEEGKEYEADKEEYCSSGFHFCENPIDVLGYYFPEYSVYHEVEGSGDIDRNELDSKVTCTKIKIGAKIDVPALCKLTFDYVRSRCTNEYTAKPGKPATTGEKNAVIAGNHGIAATGDYCVSTAGSHGIATSGNHSAAISCENGVTSTGDYGVSISGEKGISTAGDRGAATAGNCGLATAGNCGLASVGNHGIATSGNGGASTAGNHGIAISGSSSSTGDNGLSIARGDNVRVRGGLGAILVIRESNSNNHDSKEWNIAVVDGKLIKADTWYKLFDGEFTECND